MSLLGCTDEELKAILKALGYKRVRKASGSGDSQARELWGGRARSLRPARDPAPEPMRADTPFAVLADLGVARAPASKRRPKKSKRKAASPAPAGPAPNAAADAKPDEPRTPRRRRRRRKAASSKPAGDAS